MNSTVEFDQRLVEKYGITGPRYTSYPTAASFHEGFDAVAYRMMAEQSNEDLIPRPLSLYVHLPFCQSLCYYCACNKKITQHARHGVTYLAALDREIEMQGALFDEDREVIQLHFGGGTPTFFDDAQLACTMKQLATHFSFSDSERREYSIEIDPRTVDTGRLTHLAEIGFNRLSMGVQDFAPDVQRAVNRIQDEQHTLDLIEGAHGAGFGSVSVDLIYGLPLQAVDTFNQTLDTILAVKPDRLSIYNYAHLPQLFRAQRLIDETQLPAPETRLALLQLAIEKLTAAGYVYIGMDHFALPDDELAVAQQQGTLHRNFQGYSTLADCDLVGLGVSAIGKVGPSYAQNYKEIRRWQTEVESDHLPIWRGIQLSWEDRVRRAIIETVMCHGTLFFDSVERRFGVDFSEHFAPELERLKSLQEDGLLTLDEYGLVVTPAGRLLLRVVAMVFDEYMQRQSQPAGFSKVI